MAYAIDRQAVIDTAFNGRGYPIWGMAMPSTSVAYDAKLLATSQYTFH